MHVVKLNIDESSLGNSGNAGFGGIYQDHNGNWISNLVEIVVFLQASKLSSLPSFMTFVKLGLMVFEV